MYIYFLTELGGDYCTKIGFTKNLKNRLSSIQNGNPNKLHLTILLKTKNFIHIEKELHSIFKEKEKHIRGEWFFLSDDDIGFVVEKYKDILKAYNKIPIKLKEQNITRVLRRKIRILKISNENQKNNHQEQERKLKEEIKLLLNQINQIKEKNWNDEYSLFLQNTQLRKNVNYNTSTLINHKLRDCLNISNNEYIILDSIYNLCKGLCCYRYGWCTLNQYELSKIVGVTRPNLNKMISRLENKGFLQKDVIEKQVVIYKVYPRWEELYINVF
jgi:DNA-binding MarR family transcriptional regulator